MDLQPLEPRLVIRVVHSVCDRYSYYTMDDLASDLITSIWLKETKFENERHLRQYVWKALHLHTMNRAKAAKVTKLFSEHLGEGVSETDWLDTFGEAPAMQEIYIEAEQLRAAAQSWPPLHRKLFMVLSEGGSILEAAVELGIPARAALGVLQECRALASEQVIEEMRDAA